MSKSLKLVFLASMVLNLVLLGVILGRVPRGFEGAPTRQQRMEEALKKLPEAEQTRFRDRMARIRAAGDPLREPMEAVRREALRLMSAERFDEAAYDQEVGKFDALRAEMFKRMSHAVKETVQELSPEERRMFADLLRRPPQPRRD